MPTEREIRANFDRDSIVMYQAYNDAIADAALAAGKFVPPFSTRRMTWLEPSFLWLMHRSNWGLKKQQNRILAVRITRLGWEKALALAVLTSYEPGLFASPTDWRNNFEKAHAYIQWDTERTLRGAALPYSSIQVGLSRHIIDEYVNEWIIGIEDLTPVVRKIRDQIQNGQAKKASRHLPTERVYPVGEALARRLLIDE